MGALNCFSHSNLTEQLSEYFTNCSELTFQCASKNTNSHNKLEQNDISLMIAGLSHNNKITWIDLKLGTIPLDCFNQFSNYIQQSTNVHYLNLSCNCLSFSHIKLLAQAIAEIQAYQH